MPTQTILPVMGVADRPFASPVHICYSIIAIDPGKKGGIAHYEDHPVDGLEVGAITMPKTEGDVLEHLRQFIARRPKTVVYIEQVGGFVGNKGRQNASPGSAMFRFGRGVGFIIGSCMAMGCVINEVRPQEWQKSLTLGVKGNASATEWKNKLKARAQQLYPQIKVTLDTADALLMLTYAIQKEKGR